VTGGIFSAKHSTDIHRIREKGEYMRMLIYAVLFSVTVMFGQVELKNNSGLVGNYQNLQSAYDAIPADVTDSYVIELLSSYNSSSETFPVIFNYRNIRNDSIKITVRPAAEGVVIEGNQLTEIIRIDSAKNITIDGRPMGQGNSPGMKISNLSAGDPAYTISIINSSANINLQYLHSFNSTQADTLGRNILIGWSYTGNKNIRVSNCLIEGGRSGVMALGNPNAPNENIFVTDCEIKSYGWMGVKVFYGTKTMTVEGNEIYMTEPYDVYVPAGVGVSGTSNSVHNVRKNKIYNIQSKIPGGLALRGIYVYQSATGTINIENNFISLPLTHPGDQHSVLGIVLMGDNDYTARLRNNTIYLGGTHVGGIAGRIGSAGIYRYNKGVTGIYEQMNNIVVNERRGGTPGVIHAASVIMNTSPNRYVDYNTYYCSGGEGCYQVGWEGEYFNDIESYKSASNLETNSNFTDVTFISETDLHLQDIWAGNNLLAGTPLLGLTEDIDGDIRNSEHPYRGADELSTILSSEDEIIAADFVLEQNYPNPFNSGTVIKYSIQVPSKVTVKVFDVLGNEVGKLKDEFQSTGSYQIYYNPADIPSGVYFYRIEAGDFVSSKKMILLK
jgi:hypothetical protein